MRIRVSVGIKASPRRLWARLADISRHPEWMHDAVAIRYTSRRRRGVGTTFDCDTRVGPFRMVDRMEITEWRPRHAMGVRHRGVVTGEGRFTIQRQGRRSVFSWDERLRFPWWAGGPLAAVAARPVLRWVWRRNLENLKRLAERRR